jgi:hypothetical protein
MNEDIGVDLVNSIASDKFESIGRDLGEVALDSLLKEGLLRDIPVFNTLVALCQAGVEIQHQLLVRKIINFLNELSNISSENRQKFVKEIQDKREFGETLILLIQRADSLQKPAILGRLLGHHILGNISYQVVTRLSFMVDRVYISDLSYLLKFKSGDQNDPDIAASLHSVGLLRFAGINISTDLAAAFEAALIDKIPNSNDEPSHESILYELNEYGKILLKYGFGSEA